MEQSTTVQVVATMEDSAIETDTESNFCESDAETEVETERGSVTSLDTCDRPVHQLSLVNILELSSSSDSAVSTADLESEQEEVMSQALSSISSSGSLQERSLKAQKLENAIKARKEHRLEASNSPQRQRFSSSPSHNATRFCRKPKERATSEGGSPHHSVNGNHNIRIDSPCQVSVTSLNANIRLPMDRLSTKLFNPPDRAHTSLGVTSPRRPPNGGSCFGGRGRTARQYTIHPDWVSESLSIGKAPLTDRSGQDFIDFMKRSQSCPPQARNILTWDSKYTSGGR